MNHQFGRPIFYLILFFTNLSYQFESFLKNKDIEPFYCDRSKQDSLRTDDFGFIWYNDTIYFSFSFETIIFKEPIIRIDQFNRTNLLVSQPYFLVTPSNSFSNGVFGIYSLDLNSKYTIRKGRDGSFSCSELSFDDYPLETRKANCKNITQSDMKIFINENDNFFYFYLVEHVDYFILRYNKTELEVISLVQDKKIGSFKRKLNYTVQLAALDVKNERTLIEITEIKGKKSQFIFNSIEMKKKAAEVQDVEYKSIFKIDFIEFFGCSGSLKRYDQIYGIIYYSESSFYIIERVYSINIQDDLIYNRFENFGGSYIEDQIIIPSNYLDKIMYQISNNKWLKMFAGKYYLQFEVNSTEIFEISFINNKIHLNISTEVKSIDCASQTFEIRNNIYCFEGTTYFKMVFRDGKLRRMLNTTTFEIDEIFSNIPEFIYPAENLLFICNYTDNRFVLITQTTMITLRYDQILIIENDELKLKIMDVQELDHQDFCLFRPCETDRRTRFGETLKVTQKNSSSNSLSWILIFVFATLLVVILAGFILRRGRKRSRIEFKRSAFSIDDRKRKMFNRYKKPKRLESVKLSPRKKGEQINETKNKRSLASSTFDERVTTETIKPESVIERSTNLIRSTNQNKLESNVSAVKTYPIHQQRKAK